MNKFLVVATMAMASSSFAMAAAPSYNVFSLDFNFTTPAQIPGGAQHLGKIKAAPPAYEARALDFNFTTPEQIPGGAQHLGVKSATLASSGN